MKKAAARASKRERLHHILAMYGEDRITREQFEALMREQKLTDNDIDAYCRGDLK